MKTPRSNQGPDVIAVTVAFLRPIRMISLIICVTNIVACTHDVVPSGDAVFRSNCVTCHGATGEGDGPMADDLPVPPANLRGMRAANDGVFPADRVLATLYGYRGKNAFGLMPEFPGLLDGPRVPWTTSDGQVIETPVVLVDLVAYLETLQDQ